MKPIIDAVTTPPELFRELLDKAWKIYNLPETNAYLMVENYLIDVLWEFFSEKKAIMEADYLSTRLYAFLRQRGREANLRIKYIGDTSLLVSSVFTAETITSRRICGLEHYILTAATAYQALYDRITEETGEAVTFNILAAEIRKFVQALSGIFVEGKIQVESDAVIAVWKRFVNASSPKDLQWLRARGIYIPEKDILQ